MANDDRLSLCPVNDIPRFCLRQRPEGLCFWAEDWCVGQVVLSAQQMGRSRCWGQGKANRAKFQEDKWPISAAIIPRLTCQRCPVNKGNPGGSWPPLRGLRVVGGWCIRHGDRMGPGALPPEDNNQGGRQTPPNRSGEGTWGLSH